MQVASNCMYLKFISDLGSELGSNYFSTLLRDNFFIVIGMN